jgi:hypothetical protein
MTPFSGGIFGDGVEWIESQPATPEQPRALWTEEGLVFEDCYAANVIIPERSTQH